MWTDRWLDGQTDRQTEKETDMTKVPIFEILRSGSNISAVL
jgi:hypothetical protein